MRVPILDEPSGPVMRHVFLDFDNIVDPLITDPMEDKYVYVNKSSIQGDGLFAKIDILKNTVVSYFGGFHYSRTKWNDTKIFDPIYLGKAKDFQTGHYFYLPDELGKDVSKYRASLGHKINHHFAEYNCIFDYSHHPRFGLVAAARTVDPVKAGQEILCHYNLDFDEAQPW